MPLTELVPLIPQCPDHVTAAIENVDARVFVCFGQ